MKPAPNLVTFPSYQHNVTHQGNTHPAQTTHTTNHTARNAHAAISPREGFHIGLWNFT